MALGTGVLELEGVQGKGAATMFSCHEYAGRCYAKRKMDATVTRVAGGSAAELGAAPPCSGRADA